MLLTLSVDARQGRVHVVAQFPIAGFAPLDELTKVSLVSNRTLASLVFFRFGHQSLALAAIRTERVFAGGSTRLAIRRGLVFAIRPGEFDEGVFVTVGGFVAVTHVGSFLGRVGEARSVVLAYCSVGAFFDGVGV